MPLYPTKLKVVNAKSQVNVETVSGSDGTVVGSGFCHYWLLGVQLVMPSTHVCVCKWASLNHNRMTEKFNDSDAFSTARRFQL